MIQKPKGYENAKPIVSQERLPAGGYVLKIMGTEVQEYSWGNVLVLSFDVAEGEHKDYYAENYRNQIMEDKKWKGTFRMNIPLGDGSDKDNYTMSRFKTNMDAIEDSNPGYHWDWDETTLKGKLTGALFNNKEYDMNGKTGFYTNCHSLLPAEQIRKGKFTVPKDTLLKKEKDVPSRFGSVDDYEEIDTDGDLPF